MNTIDKLEQLSTKMAKSVNEDHVVSEIKKRVIVQLIMNETSDMHVTEQTMKILDRHSIGFHVDSDLHEIIDKAVRLTPEEVVDLLSPYNSSWPEGLETEELLDVLRRRCKKFSDIENKYPFDSEYQPKMYVWVFSSQDIASIVGSINYKLCNLFAEMEVKVNWDLDIRAVGDTDNTCKTELHPTIHIDVGPLRTN
mgnify:CR=1 FL=1